MSILILLSLIVFVISAIMFQSKLKNNKEDLSKFENYKGINWDSMYIDASVQLKILKAIVFGGSSLERNLKYLLLIQLLSFVTLFTSMTYLISH